MAELTQEQLEVMVEGRSPNPNVVFYESARLDQAASRESGRRMYKTQVFVKKTQPGVTDWASHVAQPKDLNDFPDEYAYFMGNKQGDRLPGIEIIPGLGIIHMQELIDLGLLNIKALAEAIVVPPNLQYAQDKAKRIYAAMKDDNHEQEEISKEIRSEAIDTGHIASGNRESIESAIIERREETVQAGRDNGSLPVSEGRDRPDTGNQSDSGRDTQRPHQSGQIHGGQVSKGVDCNWSASFNVG